MGHYVGHRMIVKAMGSLHILAAWFAALWVGSILWESLLGVVSRSVAVWPCVVVVAISWWFFTHIAPYLVFHAWRDLLRMIWRGIVWAWGRLAAGEDLYVAEYGWLAVVRVSHLYCIVTAGSRTALERSVRELQARYSHAVQVVHREESDDIADALSVAKGRLGMYATGNGWYDIPNRDVRHGTLEPDNLSAVPVPAYA